MFTKSDIHQIEKKGISLPVIEKQIDNFRKGFPFLKLLRPSTTNDGIITLTDEKFRELGHLYLQKIKKGIRPVKFIPASGAASRMFHSLFSFWEAAFNDSEAESLLGHGHHRNVRQFFDHLSQFAFYDELQKGVNGLKDNEGRIKYCEILNYLLSANGMNYGSLPKGLLKFHRYPDGPRTPVEEHMIEGALYCADSKREVNLHFTVSHEHLEYFKQKASQAEKVYEAQYGVRFKIEFSEQKPSTDTIAVDPDNNPFRLSDGSLLFRPAGHGALLDNLNGIESDVIFIKNIDNVVQERFGNDTIICKMALAGLLLEAQDRIFSYLRLLEEDPVSTSEEQIAEIDRFVKKNLFVEPGENCSSFDKKDWIKFLFTKLNRPLRVCGMVKNFGEPGGGPFRAKNSDGTTSLQIVEGSQIDMNIPEQRDIVHQSTHFNPVDLICAVYNYKGEKFDLKNFTDPETGFISHKSKEGKPLKALELPGLWNGAMADWNTLFVDVPMITFNPVKTVNDLLRKEHQPF